MYSHSISCKSRDRTCEGSTEGRKTKGETANEEKVSVSIKMDQETPKPTIDPESPNTKRSDDLRKKISKCDAKDYAKAYRTMKKFRERQQMLLGEESIEDPNPFEPTYVFYCFKGTVED